MALRHKFRAVRTKHKGISFDSKKEANYCADLDMRTGMGDVVFYLRQVPFDLPGGIKYRVDFLEFHKDGTVHFVDVKGYKTPEYKMKKKQVEALYPVIIEEV